MAKKGSESNRLVHVTVSTIPGELRFIGPEFES